MDIEKYNMLQRNYTKKNIKLNLVSLLIISIIELISIIILIMKKSSIKLIITTMIIELIVLLLVLVIIKITLFSNDKKEIYELYLKIKEELVLKVLKKHFTNITYNQSKGLTESFIRKEGLMSTGDIYSSNDSISGTYKNIKFCQSDINIEEEKEEKDDEGNVTTYYETVFRGRWLVFDFNKEFKSNLIVESGAFPNLVYGQEYMDIETEDVEFNNSFNIYAQNEHETFYILTPSFMEKLKKIDKKIQSEGIRFLFNNNKLHIGINNSDDAFEFDELKEINEQEIEANMENDIRLIMDLIDELDLTNDLFKK